MNRFESNLKDGEPQEVSIEQKEAEPKKEMPLIDPAHRPSVEARILNMLVPDHREIESRYNALGYAIESAAKNGGKEINGDFISKLLLPYAKETGVRTVAYGPSPLSWNHESRDDEGGSYEAMFYDADVPPEVIDGWRREQTELESKIKEIKFAKEVAKRKAMEIIWPRKGEIAAWKGTYGFIRLKDGRSVYVNKRDLWRTPNIGDKVRCSVQEGKKGWAAYQAVSGTRGAGASEVDEKVEEAAKKIELAISERPRGKIENNNPNVIKTGGREVTIDYKDPVLREEDHHPKSFMRGGKHYPIDYGSGPRENNAPTVSMETDEILGLVDIPYLPSGEMLVFVATDRPGLSSADFKGYLPGLRNKIVDVIAKEQWEVWKKENSDIVIKGFDLFNDDLPELPPPAKYGKNPVTRKGFMAFPAFEFTVLADGVYEAKITFCQSKEVADKINYHSKVLIGSERKERQKKDKKREEDSHEYRAKQQELQQLMVEAQFLAIDPKEKQQISGIIDLAEVESEIAKKNRLLAKAISRLEYAIKDTKR